MKIGFIGTGHMGSSLATAIKDFNDSLIILNDVDSNRVNNLNKKIKNSKVASLDCLLKESDFVFVGVKPIDADEVFKKIKEIENKTIIISMVAGKTISQIKNIINNPVIRILPNTPVAIKSGITLYNYSLDVSKKDLEVFLSFMKETGDLCLVEEKDINSISVVTGSAPAFLDYFIDALIKALKNEGINEKEALFYALKMCLGTIKLDLESEKTPLELGKEVCSPNGSTIEGVNVLLKNHLYEMVEEAFKATLKKNNNMLEE